MNANSGPRERGFTLLELLLALAISTVIIVIIFGAFRVGVRAWERGERDLAKQQRLRGVLHLVHKQLASACVRDKLLVGERPVSFLGESNRLDLISEIAVDPRYEGQTVYSRYTVEMDENGVALYLAEAPLAALPLPVDTANIDLGERYPLLSGMRAIEISYLHAVGNDGRAGWLAQWYPYGDGDFPRAVRVEVTDTINDSPIVVVIALRSRETG